MNILQPALALFTWLFSVTGNLGVTIIIVSVLSRVILFPFTRSTMRYTKKMQELKPRLDELKEKHKDDKRKHMEEQSRLMKEENVNPLAGCLPMIVQFALLIFLYNALNELIHSGINASFLWFDLSKPDILPIAGLPFGLKVPGFLVISTAATTFINALMLMPATPVKKTNSEPDFASSMQTQSLFLFPLMTLFFGTIWPSGLALYWTTSTTVDILQRYFTIGPGGLRNPFKKSSIIQAEVVNEKNKK